VIPGWSGPLSEDHVFDALAVVIFVVFIWVLAFELTREAAPYHERGGRLEARPCTRVCPHEKGHVLELQEPADVEQDRCRLARVRVDEVAQVLLYVADAARLSGLVPATGVLDQPVSPAREPLVRVSVCR
jgi:hypothetical protein